MKALCSIVAAPLLLFVAVGIVARFIWFGLDLGWTWGGDFFDWMGAD